MIRTTDEKREAVGICAEGCGRWCDVFVVGIDSTAGDFFVFVPGVCQLQKIDVGE
jgi:hypothetical protein